MTQDRQAPRGASHSHIAWIDHAKGITILLVVMLYAQEMIEHATGRQGWLEYVVDFAKPFRMPDFFLVSGILLPLAIHRGWRTFLDRKVVHFAYFYLLWLAILLTFESPWIAEKAGWAGVGLLYVKSFVHPYGLLWFIYMLAVFFVVTKLVVRFPVALVWLLAAVLQVAAPETGIKVFDKFAMYYVFFYTGYIMAPHVVALAGAAMARPALTIAGLGFWAMLEAYLVFSRNAELPGAGLVLGLLGALAVVALSALLSRIRWMAPLAYCGRHSIVIYLAFYIPLAVTRKFLTSTGWVTDAGWMALAGTMAGVAGALTLHWMVKGTRFAFLFERPQGLRLVPPSSVRQPGVLPRRA